MKTTILTIFMVLFLMCGMSGAVEYKPAPAPHYSEELGYGWRTDIPVDNPANPNSVMKVFWMYDSRLLFVDVGKDGNCDKAYTFTNTHTQNEKGHDLYTLENIKTCEEVETMIKNFLEAQKE